MKIWVLFSVSNDYDQPSANLVAWWSEQPSIIDLASAIGIVMNLKRGDSRVGRVLRGDEVRIDDVDYRLEEIEEGEYKGKS